MTTIGFEELAGPHDFVTVPNGYKGLDWTNVGAIGKDFVVHHEQHSGYHRVLHQMGVAYLYGPDGITGDATIAAPDGHTFTLSSGIFASAFDRHDHVTFTARDGDEIVGTKEVVLGEKPVTLTFDGMFTNVDSIEITWTQSKPVNKPDGYGPYLAADNLHIVVDPSLAAIEPPQTAYHFSVAHAAADWALF